MRQAVRSPWAVGLLFAMFGTALISSLSLSLAYRVQVADLKQTIYQRCLQRQAYDQSNHASVEADVRLYTALLALQEKAPTPPGPPGPQQAALARQYRDLILAAKLGKEQAADAGVIGTCTAYR